MTVEITKEQVEEYLRSTGQRYNKSMIQMVKKLAEEQVSIDERNNVPFQLVEDYIGIAHEIATGRP